ncbi:MAG: FKBP-type peptidyl-prolyl cis-trans isomerase [Brevundimonas sp.]|uniref:FKBP-type peptidyl-prolyl cis-trans isomerase n=1 Tax=Brevundimonas sp. TaxID=1871086 RepID=UPI002719D41F|nr:FKBP-type peptidyl-prolyl cis-trans isomerase [Brevundimonas sp.]MDO9586697.1 FKBP-type peptidyl-prolyl cis-trans isomerase [Brevundimonas sp.]MDP3369723.1 FKBP-type peptidyl-prolyl cis-trans isomerase [Brevundimonas sp.]MDP3656644.1 FKBP-type peptidyl-prolyl cis-trans isomerase [Brevundimonas sp.]
MNRTLLIAAAALVLAGCATAPAPMGPPTSDIRPPVGEAGQSGWNAGNAAYLAWNGGRPGWTTTGSGLQYRRISPARADGRRPVATDTVRVHYRGTFIDGREFDSSWSRGEPTEFPLNRVIRGWTEGVALMREGERFEFVIPAALGYGERWVGGGELPPNSTLLFTVELLEVKSPAAPDT